ncbi:FkbM family methyltransferase [Roseivirga sp.]|uniref:FkbM family methyltransferase n=1 Tax=Roseivirga sp. TaxID=1964215 RepID=UPI002B27A066|nr:FkbM family methyltransferase [Roseivirga sp.]
MGKVGSKVRRYRSLIGNFKNWREFLVFKSSKMPAFNFEMRNGFHINVKRQMLPPFKESFFDNIYFDGFPQEKKLTASPLVIDIGANVGFFSLNIFSKYPQAKVIAFEPMPFNYAQLLAYQQEYKDVNWLIENKAIADHSNGLTLYTSTVDGFSTMAGVFKEDSKANEINVVTTTLADVLKLNDIDKVDLLKLDCEGSEYSILYHMDDMDLAKISMMSIETHYGNDFSENHSALVKFLKLKGWNLKEVSKKETGYIWAWS